MIWDWSIHSLVFWFMGSLAVTAVVVGAGIEISELHDRVGQRRKDKHKH